MMMKVRYFAKSSWLVLQAFQSIEKASLEVFPLTCNNWDRLVWWSTKTWVFGKSLFDGKCIKCFMQNISSFHLMLFDKTISNVNPTISFWYLSYRGMGDWSITARSWFWYFSTWCKNQILHTNLTLSANLMPSNLVAQASKSCDLGIYGKRRERSTTFMLATFHKSAWILE